MPTSARTSLGFFGQFADVGIRAPEQNGLLEQALARACPTKGVRDLCRALCRPTLSKMARNGTVRQSVRQRLATKWAEQMVLGQALSMRCVLR